MAQSRKQSKRNSNTRQGTGRQKKTGNYDLKGDISNEVRPNVVTDGAKNNDPSWYTHIYPAAMNTAALPFSYPSGIEFDPLTHKTLAAGTAAASTCETSPIAVSFPGIMVLDLVPTIGPTSDSTDPANVAAQQIYAIDRAANAGAKNYDPVDIMLLITAMDSAYMLYVELLRAYRLYETYDPMSRYLPEALLTALGFSKTLVNDRANFKALLDVFAYRLGSINVPDQFDFIKRHSWLYSNVYTDSESNKAQLYAYRPDGFYIWTEGSEGAATYLKYTTRKELYGYTGTVVESIEQITSAINKIMEPIIGSQDVGIISGDLAKAFGDSGMIRIAPVGEQEALKPVYSEEVIAQMMNARIMSANVMNTSSFSSNITVDNSNLTAGPLLKHTLYFNSSVSGRTLPYVKHLLNYIKEEPTPALNMVSTRLMFVSAYEGSGGTMRSRIISSGTEVVSHAYVYYNEPSSTNVVNIVSLEVFQAHKFDVQAPGSSNDNLVNFYETALLWSKFDYAPTLYLFAPVGSTGTKDIFNGVMQDVCNYTWLDDDTVSKLNEIAVMSEFYASSFNNNIAR